MPTRVEEAQMTLQQQTTSAIATIPTCALDDAGMAAQRDRYARLSSSLLAVEWQPESVVIAFADDFDRATLEQALEVERSCCPFFEFEFVDQAHRRLRITVNDRRLVEALGVLADALGKRPKCRAPRVSAEPSVSRR
jgi:hypothetical protein